MSKVFLRLVAGWIGLGSAVALVILVRPTTWRSVPSPARTYLYPLLAFLLLVATPACVGAVRLWKLETSGLVISAAALCGYLLAEVALLSIDVCVISRPEDATVVGRLACALLALRWLLSSQAKEACVASRRQESA